MPLVIRKQSMRTGMAEIAAINEVNMRKLADMSSTQGPQNPLHGIEHLTEALLKLSAIGTDRIDLATLHNIDGLIVTGIVAATTII